MFEQRDCEPERRASKEEDEAKSDNEPARKTSRRRKPGISTEGCHVDEQGVQPSQQGEPEGGGQQGAPAETEREPRTLGEQGTTNEDLRSIQLMKEGHVDPGARNRPAGQP